MRLGLDRTGLEEMHLDELAELVRDAVLIALDNCGVRDRQPERPLEQRHHRVPVGQAADGGSLRERRDETEHGVHFKKHLRHDKDRERRCQHQARQRLDAPKLAGARGVTGGSEGKCAGGRHDGLDGGDWIAILALPARCSHRGDCANDKKARAKRAFD
jgi:hypothetical protein